MDISAVCDKKICEAIENKALKKVALLSPLAAAAFANKNALPYDEGIKKATAVLKKIGFDAVFTTAFAADLFVVEAMTQFMERKIANKNLPLVLFLTDADEKKYTEKYAALKENFATVKTIYQMSACLAKTRYASLSGVGKNEVFTTLVAPCAYADLTDFSKDIDAKITLCELAKICETNKTDVKGIKGEALDAPFNMMTGSGVICELSSGLCEASLRSVIEAAGGKELKELEFENLRDDRPLCKAEIKIKDEYLKIALAREDTAADALLSDINKGECDADIVFITAGESKDSKHKNLLSFSSKFEKTLYDFEKTLEFRKPHDNKDLKVLYNEFLDRPASDIAKKILHN